MRNQITKLIFLTITVLFASCNKEGIQPANAQTPGCATCPGNTTTTVATGNTGTTNSIMYVVPSTMFPSYYTYDQAFATYSGFTGIDPYTALVKADVRSGGVPNSSVYWSGYFKTVNVGINQVTGQYQVTGYTGGMIYAIVNRSFQPQLTAGNIFQLTPYSHVIGATNVQKVTNSNGNVNYYLGSSQQTNYEASPLR